MHEMSLARSLLRQAEQIARDYGSTEITELRLAIGPLSGVEPQLVATALEVLAPDTMAARARLVISDVPLVARCLDCDAEFEICDFRFACSRCSSKSTRVLQGEAMILESVTLAEAATKGANA